MLSLFSLDSSIFVVFQNIFFLKKKKTEVLLFVFALGNDSLEHSLCISLANCTDQQGAPLAKFFFLLCLFVCFSRMEYKMQ